MNSFLQVFDSQAKNLSERLKAFRTSLGMNQKDFAVKAGIMQSQVSEIENGKRNITSAILIALEDSFGLNRRWLINGEGHPTKGYGEQEKPPPTVNEEEPVYGNRAQEIQMKLLTCYEDNLATHKRALDAQEKNIQLLEEISRLKDKIINQISK